MTGISGPPTVSPDGKHVAFVRNSIEGSTLMIAALDESWEQLVVTVKAPEQVYPFHASWSPDGRTLALARATPQWILTTIAVSGGRGNFHWTPDGHAVSSLNRVNGTVNVWEQSVVGGAPKAITHFTSGDIFYFDWYRDGTLALSRGTELIDAVPIRNSR